MMHQATHVLALLLALILVGCGRGNGLPSDLQRHLAQAGIHITPQRTQAPLSSRGGYVVVDYSPAVATNIINKFQLLQVAPDDRQWGMVIERLGNLPMIKEIWGIGGRPTQFRLKDGAQFQSFYLVITKDGLMYLVAEYAYG